MLYCFVSGLAFFPGAATILPAVACGFLCRKKRLNQWARLLTIIGALVVAASTTPIPLWFYCTWGIVWLAWLVAAELKAAWAAKTRMPLRMAALLLTAAAVAQEIPYHLAPAVGGRKCDRLYVMGDSISAGIGREHRTWPAILAEDHGLRVRNLAKPGATVKTMVAAFRSDPEAVPPGNILVVLEIGGNDMLKDYPPEKFGQDLETLLSRLCRDGRTVVMLELPLPPLKWSYGRIQRRLAEELGATLIPKRFFAGVLLGPDATMDGLHLADRGHQAMADMIWEMVGSAMASGVASWNGGRTCPSHANRYNSMDGSEVHSQLQHYRPH